MNEKRQEFSIGITQQTYLPPNKQTNHQNLKPKKNHIKFKSQVTTFLKKLLFPIHLSDKTMLKNKPFHTKGLNFLCCIYPGNDKNSMHSSSLKKPKISHSGTVMDLGTASQAA